jgi:hypothetical protein
VAFDPQNSQPEPGQLFSNSPYFLPSDDSWSYYFVDSAPSFGGSGGAGRSTQIEASAPPGDCTNWPALEGGNGTLFNISVLQDTIIGGVRNITLSFIAGL